MALITTAAAINADSYATIEQADALATEIGNTTWDTLEESEKEAFLRRATKAIDRQRWRGRKYDISTANPGRADGQSLQFPRYHDVDSAGDAFVPVEVVECCAQVAMEINDGAATTGGSDEVAVKKVTRGDQSIEFDTSDGATVSTTDVSTTIRDLLGHLLARSAMAV